MNDSENFLAQFREMLACIEIVSERDFQFMNETVQRIETHEPEIFSLHSTSSNASTQLHPALTKRICDTLYERCYLKKVISDVRLEQEAPKQENLSALLHKANTGLDGWDANWRVYQVAEDGRLFVQKADRSRVALAGEYTTYQWPGVKPKPGDFVSLRKFTGTTEVQEAFFFAFGHTLSDQFDDYSLVRFYFNVRARGAVNLLNVVTQNLNRYTLPFQFKTLFNASAYTRPDAAVLYVARRYYPIVAALIWDMYDKIEGDLRDAVPSLSYPFARGIGAADNPKDGVSFGIHRCQLIAQTLVKAWSQGENDIQQRLALLGRIFGDEKIALTAPYLNPYATNIFEKPVFMEETRW